MAKKKTVGEKIEKAAEDVVDALSVAATGFQSGVLEQAAEEEVVGDSAPNPVRPRKRRTSKSRLR